jgi:hypothetical protein
MECLDVTAGLAVVVVATVLVAVAGRNGVLLILVVAAVVAPAVMAVVLRTTEAMAQAYLVEAEAEPILPLVNWVDIRQLRPMVMLLSTAVSFWGVAEAVVALVPKKPVVAVVVQVAARFFSMPMTPCPLRAVPKF